MDDIGSDNYGGGVSAVDVGDFPKKDRSQPVEARFNFFGGDAYVGLVIHNAFKEHGDVTAIIDGIAFSAASIAAAGAKTLLMRKHSDFGIHRSWTIAAGNRNQLAGVMEWLDSVDLHQIDIFHERRGQDREQIVDWLDGTNEGTGAFQRRMR